MSGDFNETDYKYFKQEFKDLKEHLTRGVSVIEGQLKVLGESFVRRDEFEKRFEKLEKDHKENYGKLESNIDEKLDREDFEPYKKTLGNLNWVVLSAVVCALLALVIKTT